MEKEKIPMKGGKHPQAFQEKLMTLSLNADIMSSMVLKNKEVAEEIINIIQNTINKGKKKKASNVAKKQKFIWNLLKFSIL